MDTVPFVGCYRRDVFDRIGLFDEELVRNQDDEFNFRLIRNGGRVLLVPDVTAHYDARESIRALTRMYYPYGFFKSLVARKVGRLMTVRQLVPAVFVLSLIVAATRGGDTECAGGSPGNNGILRWRRVRRCGHHSTGPDTALQSLPQRRLRCASSELRSGIPEGGAPCAAWSAIQ